MRQLAFPFILVLAAHAARGDDGWLSYRVRHGGAIVTQQAVQVATTPPFSPIQIDLESVFAGPVPSDVTVQIYNSDANGVPGGFEESVGTITLVGRSSHLVHVWIADGSDPISSDFDSVSTGSLPVLPGLRNVGGIEFIPPPLTPEDTSLRDHTALSVIILGDLAADPSDGNIAVGCIGRVQVERDLTTGVGGTISADLVATRADGVVLGLDATQYPSIRGVRAGWQITGDVVALGEPDATPPLDPLSLFLRTNWGSIGTVFVGPSLDAPGIQGDILAEEGMIAQVLSTGPIGTSSSARSSIRAGFPVHRIAARSEGATSGAPLVRDFYVDISAGLLEAREADSRSDIALIETEGDFYGRVSLTDFMGADGATNYGRNGRKDIFIGGNFYGDIDVKYDYQYGDIIARSFRPLSPQGWSGSITVGQMLKGAVVAVGTGASDELDALDGTIGSITVGFGTDLENAPRDNRPGFSGGPGGLIPAPFEGSARDAWYETGPIDINCAGEVIRAERSIGAVTIKAMSNLLPAIGEKDGRPTIETPFIGSLSIEAFHDGAVWSGKLNSPTTVIENTMSDDYAVAGAVWIGCMGPKADLWLDDVPLIDVEGCMRGEIHLPNLDAGQTIRIGEDFGDHTDSETGIAECKADQAGGPNGYTFIKIDPPEDSPRGVWYGVDSNWQNLGAAEFGRIILEKPFSLKGQVILDARNDSGLQRPSTHWKGDVLIGSGTPEEPLTPIVLSTTAARAANPFGLTGAHHTSPLGPLYEIPSHILGGQTPLTRGGAVGLVPFARYEADCNPENYRYFEETNHSNAPFLNEDNFVAGAVAAEVAYYGPVFSAEKGLELNRVNRFNPTLLGPVGDTLYTTDAANGNRARPRVVAVTGNNEVLLGGRFALLPRGTTSPTDDLLCDLGPGIAPPLTFEPADSATRFARYDFLLAEPCSQAQCSQCFAAMGFPLNQFCFIADHNNDDGIDGDDVIAFFTDWEASNQNADVNFDNGVDGDDISVFFCWWDAGGCNAN